MLLVPSTASKVIPHCKKPLRLVVSTNSKLDSLDLNPDSALLSCVSLGKLCVLSVSQFPGCKMVTIKVSIHKTFVKIEYINTCNT